MEIEYKDGKLYINDLVFEEVDNPSDGAGCKFCSLNGKCRDRYWIWEGRLVKLDKICGDLFMYKEEEINYVCEKLGLSVEHLIPTLQSCRKVSKFSKGKNK